MQNSESPALGFRGLEFRGAALNFTLDFTLGGHLSYIFCSFYNNNILNTLLQALLRILYYNSVFMSYRIYFMEVALCAKCMRG